MKSINIENLISLEEHLNQQYGKIGTLERNEFEEGFEVFKHEVLMQEYID